MRRNLLKMLSATAALALAGLAQANTAPVGARTDADLAAKAVHEIRMYSQYTIWDNVNVRVHDGSVELQGQVSQPFKKQDLQRIARSIPGVTSVTNRVEVLPLSFNDSSLPVPAPAAPDSSVMRFFLAQPVTVIATTIISTATTRIDRAMRTPPRPTRTLTPASATRRDCYHRPRMGSIEFASFRLHPRGKSLRFHRASS